MDLISRKKSELMYIAKIFSIHGRSHMNKIELIESINRVANVIYPNFLSMTDSELLLYAQQCGITDKYIDNLYYRFYILSLPRLKSTVIQYYVMNEISLWFVDKLNYIDCNSTNEFYAKFIELFCKYIKSIDN